MILRRSIAVSFALAISVHAELPSPKVLERYRQMLATNPVEGTALDRLWKAYAEAGRTGELIEGYRGGRDFKSRMILGHLLRRAGQSGEARKAYEAATALEPKSPLPAQALAGLYKEAGEYRDAAAQLEKILTLLPAESPQVSETLLELGNTWLTIGEPAKAGEVWERAVSRSPKDLELRRRLVESYLANNLPDRAVPHLEHLASVAPIEERARALQQLAKVRLQNGGADGAIQALNQAVSLTKPGSWAREEAQLQLIRTYQRSKRLPELEQQWKQHVAENPRDVGGYLQLIQLYERLGDPQEQVTWLEKLVALMPKSFEFRERLSRLLIQVDRTADAAKLLDALVIEQPANSDLIFSRARLDIVLGDASAAEQRLSELLKRRADDENLRAKALEFFRQQHVWPAVERILVQQATRNDPDAIVALAEFLFSQSREPEAEQQLRRLVRKDTPAEKQAAAWLRIAGVLKAQGRIGAAADAAAAGVQAGDRNAPSHRDALLLLGELRTAEGKLEQARTSLEEAVNLSNTTAQLIEADQRLFDCLRQQGVASGEETPQRGSVLILPTGDGPNTGGKQVAEYIEQLTKDVRAENKPAGWLRLARWHQWNRNQRLALDSANKALSLDEDFVDAHEFIIRLVSTDPNSAVAAWHYGKLAEKDPAKRTEYQRRAAQLEIQAGRAANAVEALKSLAEREPGNAEILADLANAQQHSGDWTAALGSWQKALTASVPTRRAEAVEAIIRIYEKLGQPQEAAALMLKEVDQRRDPKDQSDFFGELLTFCGKHGLLGWLEAEWRKKSGSPQLEEDHFTQLAASRILKSQGRRDEAFEQLRQASFNAPDPASTLPDLVEEAEELHRLGDAIALQERLARLSSSDKPDGWVRLAELQEANFAFADAAKTWERIESRFPRDSGSLFRAAEFWIREDQLARAAAVLRNVVTLDAANVNALALLARTEIEQGDLPQAAKHFEEVLAATTPERPGEPVRFPGIKPEEGTRLQSAYLATVRNRGGEPRAEAMRDLRSFWSGAGGDGRPDKNVRLDAIRELGRIAAAINQPQQMKAWIDRWEEKLVTSPTEALWALYYANAGPALMDAVEKLMDREPEDVQYKQAFIWMALQTQQAQRLSNWLKSPERTANDRDFLTIALGQHLESGGSVDPASMDQLFPSSAPARVVQAASVFATRQQFPQAIALGRRIFFANRSMKLSIGLELGHWHLAIGDVDGAREILRETAAQPGDSFEDQTYSALRECILLLPPPDRADFVDRNLARLRTAPPVHAAIAGAIMNSMVGNEEKAREHLQKLVQMRVMASSDDDSATSDSRPWSFLLSAGLHLQAWKLNSLAMFLWEHALADSALVRLQGEHAAELVSEMRTRLAALKIAQMPAQEAALHLSDTLRGVSKDEYIAVGEALESLGALPHAIVLYRNLWDQDLANPQPLRNLLNACRLADDQETTEAVLRLCVTDRVFPNDSAQRDFALQLADVLDRRSDFSGAAKMLKEAIQKSPQDTRLHQRLAQLFERAGNLPEAEKAWRRCLEIDPSQSAVRGGLAAVLEKSGRLSDALALLQASPSADADPRAPALYARLGNSDEAFACLERVPPQNLATAAESVASVFTESTQPALARAALQHALARTTDPSIILQLRTQLIETFDPEQDHAVILREIRNLRRLAREDVGRTGLYLTWLQRKSADLRLAGFARGEFTAAWENGRGLVAAGVALLEEALERRDPGAFALVEQLTSRREAASALLQGVLAKADQAWPELAEKINEQLARNNPMDDQRVIAWARSLQKAGKPDAAVHVLQTWGARAWVGEMFAADVAELLAELGRPELAEPLFQLSISQDSSGKSHRACVAFAKFKQQRGDVKAARRLLATAFTSPGCRDYGALVDWAEQAGRLAALDEELTALRLTPMQKAGVRRALLRKHCLDGDVKAATALLRDQPGIRDESTGPELQALAMNSGEYASVAALMESWITQSDGNDRAIRVPLAEVYTAWADSDEASGRESDRTTHLARAVELDPWAFPPVKKLALIHQKAGRAEAAKALLDQFLRVAEAGSDRVQAQRLRDSIAVR